MPNQVFPFDLAASASQELAARLADGDGFKVIGPKDFPSFIPPTLAPKFDSAVQIISGGVILFNFRRIHGENVDQHPYGAVVVSGNVAISSSFLDHGDWPDRTTPVTQELANHISASGIGGYYLQYPPEGRSSGPLSALPTTDLDAFNQFMTSSVNRA